MPKFLPRLLAGSDALARVVLVMALVGVVEA